MVLLIKYKLIEKVNCKNWFKKLIMKIDQKSEISQVIDDKREMKFKISYDKKLFQSN